MFFNWACIGTGICIFTHIYTDICVFACTHLCICMYTYIHMYTYTQRHIFLRVCVCMLVCVCTYLSASPGGILPPVAAGLAFRNLCICQEQTYPLIAC